MFDRKQWRRDNGKRLYQKRKSYYIAKAIKWRQNNPDKIRQYRLNTKITVLLHYSKKGSRVPTCLDPFNIHNKPFTIIEALTADHINSGGRQERIKNKLPIGYGFYRYLINNNFPKGIQTLCMNCQTIKRIRNKEHRINIK